MKGMNVGKERVKEKGEGGRGRGEGARLGEEGVREKTKEVGEIEGDHEGLRWKRRENKRRVKYE